MLAYIFVLFAAAYHFFPHSALAFTPVAASLLYFGARGSRRHFWVPLAVLIGTDIALTTVRYGYPLTADHVVTWAWYAGVLWLGAAACSEMKPVRVAGAAIFSSLSFFLISNFAVWAVWNMYPKTVDGLMMSYAAALPFFRHQFAGDLFFTAVLFGIGAVVQGWSTSKARLTA